MTANGMRSSGQAPVEVMAMPSGAGRERVRRVTLDDDDASSSYLLAGRCAEEYPSVSDPRFLDEVSVIAHGLPRSLRHAVNRARLDDRMHALVVSNNHVDARLGDTPLHWRDASTPGSRAADFLIMLYAGLLGDVIGWATQQDGRLVTNVLPIPGQEESLLSSSSRKELGWHTEDAFSPSRGDYVGLLCLRNPTRTPTTLSYIDSREIDADTLALLLEPRFHILPDASHVPREELGHGVDVALIRADPPAVTVLAGSIDAPVLRIDRDFTVAAPGDDRAGLALQTVVEHLVANFYSLTLAPGDMCFVDNRNVVHGRAPFVPRYDGLDRWLKRVNVVSDLRRTRPDRRSSATRIMG